MVTPRLAGTVLVLRQEPRLQVLMLRRQQALRFMGGLWAFPGGAVDAAEAGSSGQAAPGAAPRIQAAALASSRELHEEAQLRIPPSQLVHFAHWITPSGVARRFDTHFFLGLAPAGQEPHADPAETSDLAWMEPGQLAYRDLPVGDFPLSAPTQMVLRELDECLQRHHSVPALLSQARNTPILPIMPKLLEGKLLVLPWAQDYPGAPGEGIAWDRTSIAAREGWPDRLPAPAHPPSGRSRAREMM